ncbi:COG3772 Phage-related lysozyme (muraminidase) [Spirosomataceae bacterium]|jgi:lysozyme
MSRIVMIGAKGIELTKISEKFESRPYLCPAGVWTQGYGNTRNPDTRERITRTSPPINLATAERWLIDSYKKVYAPIADELTRDDLQQHEFDAIADFVFNTGGYFLDKRSGRRFPYRLFQLVNNRASPEEMRAYWTTCAITAGGKRLNGLVTRRRREVDLYLNGDWK